MNGDFKILLTFACFLAGLVCAADARALSAQACEDIRAKYGVRPLECQRGAGGQHQGAQDQSGQHQGEKDHGHMRVVYSGSDAPNITAGQLESMIFFENGGTSLSARAQEQIDVLAQLLKTPFFANGCFKLVGHSDSSGSEQANQAIGLRRAKAVRDALMNNAIAPKQPIIVVSEGEAMALQNFAPNSSWQRRVEIKVRSCGSVDAG